MNNQFEALNAPQIDLHSFFRNSYELKPTSLSFSLHIHAKKNKILILNFLWFIEPLKLTILGGSLLFEIMGAWRRLLSVRPDDFRVSHLAVDDLHGSLLVNAETTFTEVVHQTTYTKFVHDFVPRFWSNLAYLGRVSCKSSDGPLPQKVTNKGVHMQITKQTTNKTIIVIYRSFFYKDKFRLHLIWKKTPSEDF
ncbi:hypothetical protein YC2023_083877 [Brassica napus]